MAKNNLVFEFKCNKCGKPQPKNEEKSNENWEVHDCNAKCDCGGKYVLFINGQPL
jgi:hypothetical protein